MESMDTEDISKKIKVYENFLQDRLKKDLKEIEKILDDKSTKYNEWEDVKQVVKTVCEFKEKDRDMKVMFDLGQGTMASGEISDYERTYINIGLGYMLEMDCKEADGYADIRLRLLKKEIDHFRKMAVDIKVFPNKIQKRKLDLWLNRDKQRFAKNTNNSCARTARLSFRQLRFSK
ncbi:unnamed protein product [Phaedon cochleariae]|uniref:Uncharacterized protein n=1 Tax=Phaedon cochleariae TaxID=80249 RepID=A0A9N9SFJ9_PHACE|nr:unnamed protein product [Phaedon cochleariae]